MMQFRPVLDLLAANPGSELVRYGRSKKGVISLGQGEGDSATPDFIIEGAKRALAEGKTFYGPVLGCDELRQEISNYYARVYNLSIPVNRVFVTTSGTTAMHWALAALLREGDEVLAVTPIWRNLLGAVQLVEAKINEVPLSYNAGVWSLDLDRLFGAATPATKAILLTSPSNPAGWMISRAEIEAILDFARARDLWVIADEVYGRIVYDRPHAPSFLEVAEPEDKLFIVNSFSKNWAMTGWRLGWLIGPAAAESGIRDIALYENMGAPSFTQYGAIEALRHGEPFIKQQLDLWRTNMDCVHDFFRQHNRIEAMRPPATFYSFFRVDGEPDCLTFARRLIDEAGVSIAPGCSFGKVSKGFMRLCFAVSRPRLEEALSRLERAIKSV